MTRDQLDILTAYYGMMQDGCSKDQAIGFVAMLGYDAETLNWFLEKVK